MSKTVVIGTTLFTILAASLPIVYVPPAVQTDWVKIKAIGVGGTLEISGRTLVAGLTAGLNPPIVQEDGWLHLMGNPQFWLKASGISSVQVGLMWGINSANPTL